MVHTKTTGKQLTYLYDFSVCLFDLSESFFQRLSDELNLRESFLLEEWIIPQLVKKLYASNGTTLSFSKTSSG